MSGQHCPLGSQTLGGPGEHWVEAVVADVVDSRLVAVAEPGPPLRPSGSSPGRRRQKSASTELVDFPGIRVVTSGLVPWV